jgi:hypothetical protein
MKEKSLNKHHIDGLMVLLLFGVFATCVLSVLLTGAQVYSRLTDRDQAAYSQRTCTQYLATKVRQSPTPDALSIASFGDGDALVFTEDIYGEDYCTWIYCYDGWLRELFASAGSEFSPDAGEKVLAAQDLSLDYDHGLLSVRLTQEDGRPVELSLYLRGSEGVAS